MSVTSLLSRNYTKPCVFRTVQAQKLLLDPSSLPLTPRLPTANQEPSQIGFILGNGPRGVQRYESSSGRPWTVTAPPSDHHLQTPQLHLFPQDTAHSASPWCTGSSRSAWIASLPSPHVACLTLQTVYPDIILHILHVFTDSP